MAKLIRIVQQCLYMGLFLAALTILATLVATVVLGLRLQSGAPLPLLGNSPENVRRLVSRADPDNFSFVVMGDMQRGIETFEGLLALARADAPTFGVILGDFLSHPEFARHRHFASEIREADLPFPLFLVPGNHDINPDGPFTLHDFERTYGQAQFTFTLGRHLFVFLNNAPPYDDSGDYLRFLEQALAQRGKGVDDIYVFMHVPPKALSPALRSRNLAGGDRFLALAKQARIRYVFAGDHHGYWKGERDGTTYIVSGGGGGPLRGSQGRFHHMVRIAVEGGKATETVIATPARLELLESLERNLAVRLWPLMTGSGLAVAATAVVFLVAVWLLGFSTHRLWKARQDPASAGA